MAEGGGWALRRDAIPDGADPIWQDLELDLTRRDRAQVSLPGGAEMQVLLASPDPTGDQIAFATIFERSLHAGISFGPRWHGWLRSE
jgi:hypothetical protein